MTEDQFDALMKLIETMVVMTGGNPGYLSPRQIASNLDQARKALTKTLPPSLPDDDI